MWLLAVLWVLGMALINAFFGHWWALGWAFGFPLYVGRHMRQGPDGRDGTYNRPT